MHRSRGEVSLDVVSEYGLAAGGQPADCDGLRYDARWIGDLLVAQYGALMTYSRRLTANGPEAKDLVQMLCARVLSQAATMVRPDNASAWLRRPCSGSTLIFVGAPSAKSHAARMRRWTRATRRAGGPSFRAVTMDDVRSLLTALPVHYRVPYEMFSFEGLSYDEISSRLGLPCRTVGTRINRARKRLRGLLQTRYRGCDRGARRPGALITGAGRAGRRRRT